MTTATRMADKVAVVTGGARGIGLAYCERFAAEGCAVVIADVLDEEGEAAALLSVFGVFLVICWSNLVPDNRFLGN